MSNFKVCVLHEHEEKIAAYCAQNNIDFNQANAYDTVLETFKNEPIIYKIQDRETCKEVEHIVTRQVARLIECRNRTVERIGEKVELQKIKFKQKTWDKNIQRAELFSNPNLDILTENLYRLNIADENGYLALVLFLMQLKHSRNNRVPENDKTCVFFNGVARNGKSATARAICDVEEQYGEVFKAQSGKILESTHEEQVWKSHLNYFYEVILFRIYTSLLFPKLCLIKFKKCFNLKVVKFLVINKNIRLFHLLLEILLNAKLAVVPLLLNIKLRKTAKDMSISNAVIYAETANKV